MLCFGLQAWKGGAAKGSSSSPYFPPGTWGEPTYAIRTLQRTHLRWDHLLRGKSSGFD